MGVEGEGWFEAAHGFYGDDDGVDVEIVLNAGGLGLDVVKGFGPV